MEKLLIWKFHSYQNPTAFFQKSRQNLFQVSENNPYFTTHHAQNKQDKKNGDIETVKRYLLASSEIYHETNKDEDEESESKGHFYIFMYANLMLFLFHDKFENIFYIWCMKWVGSKWIHYYIFFQRLNYIFIKWRVYIYFWLIGMDFLILFIRFLMSDVRNLWWNWLCIMFSSSFLIERYCCK